ncbi:alanine--glyoxylate aminotransferase 2 homolog 3, mitochondrial-like [Camellia sinensis]|uniref:alanine--glyoxylate aminotransferase 2 homolog 3, mitochondrial-like n=1 Tax=Camellia sinensis TaxID=4442 RepID=UPI001036925E|nr:alanine--glyoxylate aminotransferase 2 homolog 3, mitochondrial-like [Camellia sinensis]
MVPLFRCRTDNLLQALRYAAQFGSLRYRRCSRKSGVHHALNPDPYRGVFGSDREKYARDVEDLITFGTSGHVAGFISEAIQGVGGIIELAPGYFPAVYSSIKKAGGLCIADEVQSRFAHTGSHFWGFETQGIVPDIVTMAKVNKLHEVC